MKDFTTTSRHAAAAAIAAALFYSSANAQEPCRGGRTASGACVNAPLTASMQQRAIVFSQAQLSFLGPPLPFANNGYADAVRDRQALSYGIQQPLPTQNAATPGPGTFIGLPANVNPASLNIAAPFTVVPGGIRIR